MVTRTALFGVVAAAALAVVPMAQAQSPADAHQRQQATSAAAGGSHDRSDSAVTPTMATVVADAHDRGSLPLSTSVAVVESGGFDWGDAMIGAGGGVGLALVLGGLAFLLVGQRGGARAAVR